MGSSSALRLHRPNGKEYTPPFTPEIAAGCSVAFLLSEKNPDKPIFLAQYTANEKLTANAKRRTTEMSFAYD